MAQLEVPDSDEEALHIHIQDKMEAHDNPTGRLEPEEEEDKAAEVLHGAHFLEFGTCALVLASCFGNTMEVVEALTSRQSRRGG